MQFDLRTMVEHMGGVAWGVVIVLAIMSIYSIGVMIERYYTYQPGHQAVAQVRPRGRPLPEAGQDQGGHRRLPRRRASSTRTWPRSWWSACRSGSTSRRSARPTGTRKRAVDAAKRAIQRATAVNLADLKRGLSGLATIGSTAPFVGLFGTTFGIINAFSGMALTGLGRYRGHLGRHRRGAHHHRLRPLRGRARGVGVQLLRGQGRGLQRRDGQLQLRAARLLHQEGRLAAGTAPGRRRAGPATAEEHIPCR